MIVAALTAGGVPPTAVSAQGPDLTGLQQQVEKLNAGQEALRKDLQAMQRQIQEMASLLQARPAQSAAAPQPPLPAEIVTDGVPFKGAPGAPLTIVEFSDFQCPFCGRHWNQTFGQIDRDYIATGKVRYAFRHFPLERIHPQALKAGEAAECAAGQGKFWEMHDRLFANQQALMPADLVKHAEALGLDQGRFATCFAGQMTARVRADLALGTVAGVASTPSFFLGTPMPGGKIKVLRKLTGALPYATFKSTIDGLLASDSTTP
jgi:protein-disulfide isomerase